MKGGEQMFSIFAELKWFFREHRIRYSVALILLIAVGLLELLPPILIGKSIDHMSQGTLSAGGLSEIIWMLAGIAVIVYVITYTWLYQLEGGAYLLERKYRSKLIAHFLKMAPGFYGRYRTGDLMARATNDLEAVGRTAGFGILTLVDSSIYMATILLMMGFAISWKLTIAAVLPLFLIIAVIQVLGKIMEVRYSEAQKAFGTLNNHVLDAVEGVRTIRAYVQEADYQQDFKKRTEAVYEKNLNVVKITALMQPAIKLLVAISFLVGFGYGIIFVFQNKITLGQLITFNVYLGMMIWPMYALNELVNIMQKGNASLKRVQEVLHTLPDIQNPEGSKPNQVPDEIRFEQVTFRYPSADRDQLQAVSFVIRQGETIGIVGKTGSGKSTLLKQLLREYPPGTGRLDVSGTLISELPLEVTGGWIGYVPQEHLLFSSSIRENILFGRPEADEQAVQHAVASAALADDIGGMPEGLETLIGEKGVSLSGGQKQRVSIARALIADPEILILDDALSAVDANTERTILSSLRKERQGRTTLIATHRLAAIQHADRILVMDQGRIIEQGTHEQLLALKGWYHTQFERQQIETELL